MGDRLSHPGYASDQESSLQQAQRTNQCRHLDSALWLDPEPEFERGALHFHLLFFDGVYTEDQYVPMRLHRVKALTREELVALVHKISHRISQCRKKKGYLQY